jgi:hypothetical protein
VNVALHCTHAVIAAPAKFSRMRLFFYFKKSSRMLGSGWAWADAQARFVRILAK